MFNTNAVKSAALALLLTSAGVGAVAAQTIPPEFRRSGSCTGGLSTLTGSFARFHVALDDDSDQPGIIVVMRFINHAGTVIRSKTAAIGAGGSATLEYRGPSVLYRVQADIYESLANVAFSDRRSYVGSGETEVSLIDANDIQGYRLVGPGPMKVSCTPVFHTK